MDQLIQRVRERANVDDDQARTAINTVVDFLQERLPEPIGAQVESVLGGDGERSDSPVDQVGSLFGR